MPRNAKRSSAARRRKNDPSRDTIRRPLTFKFRVTPGERDIIRDRARGYSSPAEYARRTLIAGWAPRSTQIAKVTDAFVPLQEAIDLARAHGHAAQADAAIQSLREILSAVNER